MVKINVILHIAKEGRGETEQCHALVNRIQEDQSLSNKDKS